MYNTRSNRTIIIRYGNESCKDYHNKEITVLIVQRGVNSTFYCYVTLVCFASHVNRYNVLTIHRYGHKSFKQCRFDSLASLNVSDYYSSLNVVINRLY